MLAGAYTSGGHEAGPAPPALPSFAADLAAPLAEAGEHMRLLLSLAAEGEGAARVRARGGAAGGFSAGGGLGQLAMTLRRMAAVEVGGGILPVRCSGVLTCSSRG